MAFCRQLLHGHAFGLLDDLLGRSQIFGLGSGRFLCGSLGGFVGFSGFGRLGIFCGSGRVSRGRRRSGSAGSHGQNHHSSQQKRKHLLHSDIPPVKFEFVQQLTGVLHRMLSFYGVSAQKNSGQICDYL